MQPSTALRRAVSTARQVRVLVVVPFLVAVSRWRDVVATGADASIRFGVTFPTPHSFVSLWSFVNAPAEAGAGDLPLVVDAGGGAAVAVQLVAYAVFAGLVLAGYLGSIADGVAGDAVDVAANVRRYARPLVAYQAVSTLAFLGLAAGAAWRPVPVPAVAAVLFVVAYLTYLTPYLVVVADVGLLAAARRSLAYTTGRAAVAAAFAGFALLGAVLSVPLSTLAYGNGVVGPVLAAALAAPVGLVASAFFVVLARDLAGGATDPAPP